VGRAGRRLSALVARVWIVAVIGVVATAGLVYQTARAPGVYFGSADVVLVLPPSPRTPNALGLSPVSLIATAGVLQREVSGGPDAAHVVSGEVTIVDEGEMNGVSVTLPNSGGQWANNFERASLHVQAADRDQAVALDRLRSTVAAIQSTLAAREDAANVLPERRIRTEISPTQLSVALLSGERKRAMAASAALGLGITFALMVLVDARRFRRFGQSSAGSVTPNALRRRLPRST
jgi:hypothetical protein